MATNPKLARALEEIRRYPNKYTLQDVADTYKLTYASVAAGYNRNKKRLNLRVLQAQPTPRVALPLSEKRNTENIGIVGDVHAPFTVDGYLEFCVETFEKYGVTHVIFIGDTIDNHATSLYDPDPDLQSPADELQRAIRQLNKWHEVFPHADVVTGNHEKRVNRAIMRARVTRRWMRDYADVLQTPTWTFESEFIYDNVRYIHGEGMNAEKRAVTTGVNTVCGDKHTQAWVKHIPYDHRNLWAMQVGCGLDRKSPAAAYAINYSPQVIGCGLVLEHGRIPFVIPML